MSWVEGKHNPWPHFMRNHAEPRSQGNYVPPQCTPDRATSVNNLAMQTSRMTVGGSRRMTGVGSRGMTGEGFVRAGSSGLSQVTSTVVTSW
jgi:hypothetical protein